MPSFLQVLQRDGVRPGSRPGARLGWLRSNCHNGYRTRATSAGDELRPPSWNGGWSNIGTAPLPGRRQFSLRAHRHVTGIAVRPPASWYGIARSWPLVPVGLSGHSHFDWGCGTWTQGGSSESRNSSSEPGAHAHGGIAAKRVRGRRGGPDCRKSCFHGTR